VIARRDRRVRYLIYERRIVASYATSSVPAWTPRPYYGLNAHAHHLHVSVLDTKTAKTDTSPWFTRQKDWSDMATAQEVEAAAYRANVRALNDVLSQHGSDARTGLADLLDKPHRFAKNTLLQLIRDRASSTQKAETMVDIDEFRGAISPGGVLHDPFVAILDELAALPPGDG
jgi:hypothetical protein